MPISQTKLNEKKNELVLIAEIAIREEIRKYANLAYEELSPLMRELLAKVFVRGGVEALEKLQEEKKELLANS